ncbi:hypothetical protein WCP94_001760 [Bilophila wadsworthia]
MGTLLEVPILADPAGFLQGRETREAAMRGGALKTECREQGFNKHERL